MAKNGSRRRGLVSRVYAPVGQVLRLASNTVGVATNTARNIVQRSIRAVNNVGSSVTRRANLAINGVLRGTRKNRRNTRRGTRRGNRR